MWDHLSLPHHHLSTLNIPSADEIFLPSSFKVSHLAQSSIALSALAASLIHSARNATLAPPTVTVPLHHACAEFKSERFYTLDGTPPQPSKFPIGGLHRTRDGHVRIHDGFPHHRAAALRIIGCPSSATANEIKDRLLQLSAPDLEAHGLQEGAIIATLRSFDQWDAHPQSAAVSDFPVEVRKVVDGPKGWKPHLGSGADKCLRGLRVLEFSRVIAAPVAGRTLAAHGADVLWVASPHLPTLEVLDVDVMRGKRKLSLDLNVEEDRRKMEELLAGTDVVLQGYRPGALAKKGLGLEEVVGKARNGVVYASLSAYGSEGPWSGNRGFDSIVQTLSGLNVAEAEAYGEGNASKVLPCQALDHASGYFLAYGIMAALYRQATEGGSYAVEVSLAATMKYLRSLGRYEDRVGLDCQDYLSQEDVPHAMLETTKCRTGQLTAIKHSATIEGLGVGFAATSEGLDHLTAGWI